jgi:hypothetical protein
VAAVRRLFASYPDRAATRRHAAGFCWQRTSREHLELLRQALDGKVRSNAPAAARATSGGSRTA